MCPDTPSASHKFFLYVSFGSYFVATSTEMLNRLINAKLPAVLDVPEVFCS